MPSLQMDLMSAALQFLGVPPVKGHSCASLLLDRPEIRLQEVSELLGHARSSITLDIYAHVISPRQRDLTSAMDQLFLRPAPEVPQDRADAGTASTPDTPAPGGV